MFYVYLLKSLSHKNQKYTGYTTNLKQRFADHNSGESVHTNKYMPWKLCTYIAFDTKEKAMEFEKYLKSGSGRAFVKKHFW